MSTQMVLYAWIDVLPLPINPPNVTGAPDRRGNFHSLRYLQKW